MRAAWWHCVNHSLAEWSVEHGFSLKAMKGQIVELLEAIVPRPSGTGLRDFGALLQRASDDLILMREEAARREGAALAAKLEAERLQRKREEAARPPEYEQWDEVEDDFYWGSANDDESEDEDDDDPGDSECFAILGLQPCASLDEVRLRHRALAMKHHPDKGGDSREFVKVRTAYEAACKTFDSSLID